MSDITPPMIIRNTQTPTELFDPTTGNIIARFTTPPASIELSDPTTGNNIVVKFTTPTISDTPDRTITDALRAVKEGLYTSALGVYQLDRLSIPYVKQGTLWGYEKTSQAAKTAVPYIKSGLAKVSSVLTNAVLLDSQRNNLPESDSNTPDTISTSISNSAKLPDHLISDQARSHQGFPQACSALGQLSYCSNAAAGSQVMNNSPLQQVSDGNFVQPK
ncbi:MAG: hypothetical protein AB2989_01965 [Candidatus Symbiodolus clandestinus]